MARVLISLLGIASIAWGLYVLPALARSTVLERTAKHIIAGDTFPEGALANLKRSLSDSSVGGSSVAIRSGAIIRLRAVEKSIDEGDARGFDEGLSNLKASVRSSLLNAPADPFLWLVLFWLENTQNGFSRRHLKYLQMSYLLGPNEGWIAIKRNRQALAIFAQLPQQLKTDAIAEFSGLVRSDLIPQAANIFVGPGWPIRDKLLSSLRNVPQLERERFAKLVYDQGYDVEVPGIRPPPPRPWR